MRWLLLSTTMVANSIYLANRDCISFCLLFCKQVSTAFLVLIMAKNTALFASTPKAIIDGIGLEENVAYIYCY